LRRMLLTTAATAAASLLIATYLESSMQSQQDELHRQIAQRRGRAMPIDDDVAKAGPGREAAGNELWDQLSRPT